MSEQLAGRFFNAFGDPIDGGPDIEGQEVEIGGPSVNPVRRKQPSELIATGIAGIDLNNTLVSGQKIPFFALHYVVDYQWWNLKIHKLFLDSICLYNDFSLLNKRKIGRAHV